MYFDVFSIYFNVFQKKLLCFKGIIKYVEGIWMYINVFQCIIYRLIGICTFGAQEPHYLIFCIPHRH
jgi:hypothetical protein